jgi:NADH-quinone oxidoreductase subunit L
MIQGAWVCLLAPLGGMVLITLAGMRISRRAAGYVSTLSVAVAFAGAIWAFVDMLGRDASDRTETTTAYTWLTAGHFDFGLRLIVDPLSAFMMLVVSGVGMLIVAYSIGYMDGADEERRYFAYMSLFVFSMLLLVQAGNLVILLAGWGLVGLCSYLLIGFEHERFAAVAAAKKAFIMNAVGDATMALALFVLVWQTGTLDMPTVFDRVDAGALGGGGILVDLVALGLLGGAVAKSAQIPLHTWLPDAMEGPTPVSALIHAATMVTAGVYLIVRTHVIFEAAPSIQDLAAGLGAATLLMAGLIALVQTDIKRVIAYSTMSQIGYMFVAAGIGAYANGMFHLMTHAFFKALLFLAAGVVIHALIGEQDMRRMGGLRKYLPWTYVAMLFGALALAGIPPFAGFFSKDAILASALADGGWWGYTLFVVGVLGAFLTGLYTFRMIFLVFEGEPSAYVREHFHRSEHGEGPGWMTRVVAILALLSLVGGWIEIAGIWHPLSDFLEPTAEPLVEPSGTQELVASLLAVGVGVTGIAIARLFYGPRRVPLPRADAVRTLLEHKFYFDEAYDLLFYRPLSALASGWLRFVERPVIAGSLRGLGLATRGAGAGVGEVQTGLVRLYALALAAGVAVLVLVFVAVR